MKNILLLLAFFSPLLARAQWQTNNLDSIEITSLCVSDSSVYVGTTGGLYISNNYGFSWTYSGFNPNIYKVNTVAKSGTTLFVGSNNSMKTSSDGGDNWQSVFAFTNFSVNSIIVNNGNLFAASLAGVHISTDNGNIWTNVSNGLPQLSEPRLLVASGSHIFSVADSMVFLSTNNGLNWTITNSGLTNTPVHSLAINGTTLFAGTSNGIFISTNNGGLWTAASIGLPNSSVHSIALTGTNIFAATDSGVFFSSNNGALWTSINTGLPNHHIKFLAISGTKIFAALSLQTPTGELWNRLLSQLVSVEEIKDDHHFLIYPNPTSGLFRIGDADLKIHSLDIFNLMGENVFHLDNQYGKITNEIDVSAFSKGIYFINMIDEWGNEANEKIIVNK